MTVSNWTQEEWSAAMHRAESECPVEQRNVPPEPPKEMSPLARIVFDAALEANRVYLAGLCAWRDLA